MQTLLFGLVESLESCFWKALKNAVREQSSIEWLALESNSLINFAKKLMNDRGEVHEDT